MVCIAVCLLILVLRKPPAGDNHAQIQGASPAEVAEPQAPPATPARITISAATFQTARSTVVAPAPDSQDSSVVATVAKVEVPAPTPSLPAGGFLPRNLSGQTPVDPPGGFGTITIKGADTLVILARTWGDLFTRTHPGVKIQVMEGGSGAGFASLQNGTADIAESAREIKPSEVEACMKAFGSKPTEYIVAIDGVGVFVKEANPVQELTLDQLAAIFTGTIKNWNAVGGEDLPITLYSLENSSGAYESFRERVLRGRDVAASAQIEQGTQQLVQSIVNDKSGIGFGVAHSIKGSRPLGVKVDATSPAILPTRETVLNKTYPIRRELYNYVNPAHDKGVIHAYLNYIRSADGQSIVGWASFYPLPVELQSK